MRKLIAIKQSMLKYFTEKKQKTKRCVTLEKAKEQIFLSCAISFQDAGNHGSPNFLICVATSNF